MWPTSTLEKQNKPILTPPPQARTRESSRVKEFPAGNTATSASRIAFLNSLCSSPKFRALVDLVQAVVRAFLVLALDSILLIKFQPHASPIPSNYPSWASWKSREVYLPANFHSSDSFKNNLSILKSALGSGLEGGKIDAPLLLLGLMYREVSRSMEIEPGAPTKASNHLINSLFGIQEVNKIERLMDSVHLPSYQ